jgi:hypothetical protein
MANSRHPGRDGSMHVMAFIPNEQISIGKQLLAPAAGVPKARRADPVVSTSFQPPATSYHASGMKTRTDLGAVMPYQISSEISDEQIQKATASDRCGPRDWGWTCDFTYSAIAPTPRSRYRWPCASGGEDFDASVAGGEGLVFYKLAVAVPLGREMPWAQMIGLPSRRRFSSRNFRWWVRWSV